MNNDYLEKISFYTKLIINNIPDEKIRIQIGENCNKNEFHTKILIAIFAIETTFRPYPVRICENFLMFINILFFRFLGLPIFDASIGPFQLKISTGASILSIDYTIKDNFIKFNKTTSVLNYLAKIWDLNFSIKLALKYIQKITHTYAHANSNIKDLITNIGENYNGDILYSEILYRLVKVL